MAKIIRSEYGETPAYTENSAIYQEVHVGNTALLSQLPVGAGLFANVGSPGQRAMTRSELKTTEAEIERVENAKRSMDRTRQLIRRPPPPGKINDYLLTVYYARGQFNVEGKSTNWTGFEHRNLLRHPVTKKVILTESSLFSQGYGVE